MANLSPGVAIQEVNLTTIIPAAASTVGATAGFFRWGPVNKRILLDSEASMSNVLQPPNSNTAVFYWSAANFYSYGNSQYIVRANSGGLHNATAIGTPNIMIPNEDVYFFQYYNGNGNAYGQWFARYPGDLGNSILVSTCPSSQAFAANLTALYGITATANVGSNLIQCSAAVSANVIVGDFIQVGSSPTSNGFVQVTGVSGANITTAQGPVSSNASGLIVNRKWQFASQFNGAPSTSAFANTKSAMNDQLHIIVIDANGSFNGSTSNNYILEKYSFLSKASDAKNNDSSPAYYPTVIFNKSKYIYWADHIVGANNWGSPAQGVSFATPIVPTTLRLSGGSDITNPYNYTTLGIGDTNNDAGLITAYGYFQSTDDVGINLVPTGPASITVQQWVIDNIVDSRLDCVAFISPRYGDVVNQVGNEATNIVNNYLPSLGRSSTFVVMDSGWKYQFDRYAQSYTYVPLNPDIAGLCVYTDSVRTPAYSPAGYNRGFIKNVTKLAWNPSNVPNAITGGNAYRDLLYTNAVNPVVTFKDVGTILFGDKTLTAQPSAFDRIGVRRIFIVMEQAISTAAKYALFEFNDNFTRTQFVNQVNPYLAQQQGQRSIQAFYVQCDSNNNPPAVVQANQFVGAIYVQPNYSINWITLQFVAVGPTVTFQTIIGQTPPTTSG